MEEVLYHYTSGNVFRRILQQTAIMPDRSEPENPHEIPTVTFSSDPVWEKSRFRVGRMPDGQLIMMSKALLNQYDGGLIRIVVPKSIAPLDWHGMKEKCGMSKGAQQGIYDFAVAVGARTKNWYATFEAVPEDQWTAVEKLDDTGNWVMLSDDNMPVGEVDNSPLVDIPAEAISMETTKI